MHDFGAFTIELIESTKYKCFMDSKAPLSSVYCVELYT